MPAVSAGNCDPIEATLRASLEGANSGSSYLDDQLISSAKRVLLTKIDFHPAEKEYSSSLKSLQSKYIRLNSNSDGSLNHKEDNYGSSSVSVNGSHEDCRLDADGIPVPRVVIHPVDNIKLGWLRVYKIGAGLANLGNTCFLNATLQCLTYTPPLVNHLIEYSEHSSACKNVGFCMMCELQRHIRRALEKNGEIIRPQCILQKLKSIAAHMTWGRQEDAHEFLHYMMESMISSSLNGYSTAKLDRISYETTVVNQIFGGYHRSQVICLRCKEKSDTYDHFMDIMLDIKNVPSLEKALEHFVQPEVLDNENAYMCPKCKQKCPAKKRFTVHRAPNITTFQLKRFDYSRSMGGKITKHVSFPERFDMRSYMSQRQGPPITYLLFAVLVHQGVSCNSGHYFCFVRNSNNLWYLMDDSKVRQVSVNVVLSQQAYLLFYTRVPNSGQLIKSPHLPSTNNRLPFTPVSSTSSAVTNNTGSSGIMNGIAGKPVNDSLGVPLVRKPNILNSNLVKPKPILPPVLNTANNKPTSLHLANSSAPATMPSSTPRERIPFDFKLSNSHHAQTSPTLAKGSAQNSTSAAAAGNGSSSDATQPKHPRIVMQIKNGRVINYPQQSREGGESAATPPTFSSTSLVPYAPDSSEESDQDNGRLSSSPRCRTPFAVSAPNAKDRAYPSNHNRVKLDPQLNATTHVPGLPKLKIVEDKVVQRDGKAEFGFGATPNGSAPTQGPGSTVSKKLPGVVAVATEGQLTVVTNSGGAGVKVTATSPWVVQDSSQQSPSVASEGSNTSVSSTTGWSVVDSEKELVSPKMERQCPRWMVTHGTGSGGANSTKKTAQSKCENSVKSSFDPAGAKKHRREDGPSPVLEHCPNGIAAAVTGSRSGNSSKKDKDCESAPLRRTNPAHCESDNLSGNDRANDAEESNKAKSSVEYKWANGAKLTSDESPCPRLQDNHLAQEEPRVQDAERTPSGSSEDSEVPPLVNGCKSDSQSPDEQTSKRHKRKKKHRKEREAPDEEAKWRKKSGKRKDSPDCNNKGEPTSGESSPSRKKRKHSSSESSSSDGYELEWVEKTKETLEEEKTKSQVPVKQWDEDVKDGFKKQMSDPPLKNGEVANSAMLGMLNNGTATVVEILKKGGRGYGDGVKSWDGCQSMVNRDMEQEMHFNYSRCYSDAYNQGYDRGKAKKVKHPRRYNSNPNLGPNPFQRMQDLNEAGKYFTPNRWHFNPHSPYQWDGHYNCGNMHHHHYRGNNSRNRHYFHHNNH